MLAMQAGASSNRIGGSPSALIGRRRHHPSGKNKMWSVLFSRMGTPVRTPGRHGLYETSHLPVPAYVAGSGLLSNV